MKGSQQLGSERQIRSTSGPILTFALPLVEACLQMSESKDH